MIPPKKNILVIIGSASRNSSNEKLADRFRDQTLDIFDFKIYNDLSVLPHFDTDQTINNPPAIIEQFRKDIQDSDAVLISTPEYIFSIPSGLKNAIEWCVATTVFTDKPLGIITASADGRKGHEELQLIMKTVMANFSEDTTLLINGVKGKVSPEGAIIHPATREAFDHFVKMFVKAVVKRAGD